MRHLILGHIQNFCLHHVFKIRTCTQLHFHWIERGNVWRENRNHFKLRHKATETQLVGNFVTWKFYYNVVFQNLVFKLICVNKTTKQHLMQKLVQLDSWTWYKYFINMKLACGTASGVWRESVTFTPSNSSCLKTFPRFYPMRMRQCRCASNVITNSVT